MAKIQTIKNSESTIIYPQTHTQAVYDAKGKKLQEWMNEYLTTEDESAIEDVNTSFEIQGNKTTVLDSNSTNTQYPAAKTVYDFVTQNFQTMVDLSLKYTIVPSLPSEGEHATIYLVQNFDNMKEQNIYDEYLYINDKWEKIGDTKIDLTNYATKDFVRQTAVLKVYEGKETDYEILSQEEKDNYDVAILQTLAELDESILKIISNIIGEETETTIDMTEQEIDEQLNRIIGGE